MKLVRNPAPPAANPCSAIVKSSVAPLGDADRMSLCSCVYATKTDAVSAIEPTSGTGRP